MRGRIRGALRRTLIPLLAAKRVRRLLSKFMVDRASIFMIHGIAESPEQEGPSAALLASMLEELRARRISVVSLESILERHIAGEPQVPDSVAFTLDDGTRQQMELTTPLLARYDCEATVFLITGFVDRRVWPWDYQVDFILSNTRREWIPHALISLPNPLRRSVRNFDRDAIQSYCKGLPRDEVDRVVAEIAAAAEVDLPASIPAGWEPLTWEGARRLERQGIRFAPHGVSHSILTRLSPTDAEAEIKESWKRVKEEMASPCPVFAWPTGRSQDFGSREIGYAKEAGLIGAVTASCDYAVLPMGDRSEDLRYRLGRFAMPDNSLDLLQYSTWIEFGKQRLLPRRRSGMQLSSRGCS